jgi:hypothetical protein
MAWSVSISFENLNAHQVDDALDTLTKISLAHQDAMADWYDEQKRLEEKKNFLLKKMKQEEQKRIEQEQISEKWKKEEFEREKQYRANDKKINRRKHRF